MRFTNWHEAAKRATVVLDGAGRFASVLGGRFECDGEA